MSDLEELTLRQRYRKYLKSPEWGDKNRPFCMQRDYYTCRCCGEEATDVHHLSYEFLGTEKETAFCISVCKKCHDIQGKNMPNNLSEKDFKNDWENRRKNMDEHLGRSVRWEVKSLNDVKNVLLTM